MTANDLLYFVLAFLISIGTFLVHYKAVDDVDHITYSSPDNGTLIKGALIVVVLTIISIFIPPVFSVLIVGLLIVMIRWLAKSNQPMIFVILPIVFVMTLIVNGFKDAVAFFLAFAIAAAVVTLARWIYASTVSHKGDRPRREALQEKQDRTDNIGRIDAEIESVEHTLAVMADDRRPLDDELSEAKAKLDEAQSNLDESKKSVRNAERKRREKPSDDNNNAATVAAQILQEDRDAYEDAKAEYDAKLAPVTDAKKHMADYRTDHLEPLLAEKGSAPKPDDVEVPEEVPSFHERSLLVYAPPIVLALLVAGSLSAFSSVTDGGSSSTTQSPEAKAKDVAPASEPIRTVETKAADGTVATKVIGSQPRVCYNAADEPVLTADPVDADVDPFPKHLACSEVAEWSATHRTTP